MRKILIAFLSLPFIFFNLKAEDGYRLWWRYDPITDQKKLALYHQLTKGWFIDGESPTFAIARKELQQGLDGLLSTSVPDVTSNGQTNGILAGTSRSSSFIASLGLQEKLKAIGREGFLITTTLVNNRKTIVIAASEDIGVLYGVFHFLRLLQTQQDIINLSIELLSKTKISFCTRN